MIPDALTFAHPWALLGLLAAAAAAWLLHRRRRSLPRLVLPETRSATGIPPSRWARVWWLPGALLIGAVALTSLGLAGPRLRAARRQDLSVEGIDIVVAFDLSTSMLAADFRPKDRITVAKEVLKSFIASRQNDRIGLVVFAGEAYTQCPLTLDYKVLDSLLDQVRTGVIVDGTAIGNALGTAVIGGMLTATVLAVFFVPVFFVVVRRFASRAKAAEPALVHAGDLEEVDPGLGVVEPVPPGELAKLRPRHLGHDMMEVRLECLPLAGQQRKCQRAGDHAQGVGEPSRQPGDRALDHAKPQVCDHDGSRTGCIGDPGLGVTWSTRQTGRNTSHWSGSWRMIRSKNCTIRSVVTWMSRCVSPVRLTSIGASISAM